MKFPVALAVVFVIVMSCAATPDYTITILNPDTPAVRPRPEYRASTDLVGKNISAIFGPLSEVRVELDSVNKTVIDGDTTKVERRIRERINRAKCLGRESEIAWHKAPWVHGYILFKDGRILPIKVMLSGIIIGDFLFADKVETN